jgi:cell division protein FtsN
MRRYFDDEDRDEEEARERDTEVTLTPGALAGIVFGLLLLCGLCFGGGYWVGHRSSGPPQAAAAQTAAPTAAPDEEPLQANSSVPKPSAEAQAPVAPPAQPADNGQAQPAPGSAGANRANPQPNPAPPAASEPPPSAPASAPAAQPQAPVRPAFSSGGNAAQQASPGYPSNVRAAMPEPGQLMVQIAAVSHEEDAEVLVNALRKRGYSATAHRDPRDGMVHVRIGPFTARQEADRMARRLLDDGYNAMVQP